MDFWRQAEAIETLIDAYNINNDADLKNNNDGQKCFELYKSQHV